LAKRRFEDGKTAQEKKQALEAKQKTREAPWWFEQSTGVHWSPRESTGQEGTVFILFSSVPEDSIKIIKSHQISRNI